jgi:hypothetical protein
MKEMNKKGQQMTLGTIIAIVLGITVLVFLIWGFSTGWSNMWNKITAFGGGSANIDTIVQACALACSTQNEYGFCTEVRTVKFGKEVTVSNNKFKEKDGTCQGIVDKKTDFPGVNVDACPGLCATPQ